MLLNLTTNHFNIQDFCYLYMIYTVLEFNHRQIHNAGYTDFWYQPIKIPTKT